MKKLFACLALCMLLSGCGSYRELNDLILISGGGLEQARDGSLTLTAQLLTLPEGESTPKPELLTVAGQTPAQAFQAFSRFSGKTPYWSHCQSFLLGETLSRSGVTSVIEALLAAPEIRLTDRLLVTAGTAPEPVLTAAAAAGEISGYDLYALVSASQAQLDMPLYRFAACLWEEGIDPVLPAVALTAQGKPALQGTAVFRGDRLAGYLDDSQTQTLMLLSGKIQGMPLTLDNGETYLLDETRCRITPAREESGLCFTVHLSVQARLAETTGSASRLRQALESRIASLFSVLRDELQADSLGLMRQAYRYLPAAQIPENPYQTARLQTQISLSFSPAGSVTQPLEVNAYA